MTAASTLFAEARAASPRERERRRALNARILGEMPDEASPVERLADNLRRDIATVCRALARGEDGRRPDRDTGKFPRYDRAPLSPPTAARLIAVAMRGALLDMLIEDGGLRLEAASLEATLALIAACKGRTGRAGRAHPDNLPLEGRSKPAEPASGGGEIPSTGAAS